MNGLEVEAVDSRRASEMVIAHHYLHRRPPISFAYGLFRGLDMVGVVTFGTPPSRHLQMGACPSNPGAVVELNRLFVLDSEPRNTESWFVSRVLRMLPPRIVVSYADTREGHLGIVYRALSFRYAGWTDMDRKTPRYDYVPADPAAHSRDAFRNGYVARVRRLPKVRYWTVTGNHSERRKLEAACGWPSMDWAATPPPVAP